MPGTDDRPFGGITDLFSELSRIRDVGLHGREVGSEERERSHANAWVPATDIVAQGDDLLIRVELAGVAPDEVDLGFDHGVLTVAGRRRTQLSDDDPANFYVRERPYGEFRRSFTLPEGTRAGQISATFDNGLVEVVVRGGVRSSRPTRIEIKDRSSGATTRSL